MSMRAQLQSRIDKLLEGRSPRERQIVIWGAAASLLVIFVLGIWLPLQQAQLRLERSEQCQLAWRDLRHLGHRQWHCSVFRDGQQRHRLA